MPEIIQCTEPSRNRKEPRSWSSDVMPYLSRIKIKLLRSAENSNGWYVHHKISQVFIIGITQSRGS
jgi:hypothetical protein